MKSLRTVDTIPVYLFKFKLENCPIETIPQQIIVHNNLILERHTFNNQDAIFGKWLFQIDQDNEMNLKQEINRLLSALCWSLSLNFSVNVRFSMASCYRLENGTFHPQFTFWRPVQQNHSMRDLIYPPSELDYYLNRALQKTLTQDFLNQTKIIAATHFYVTAQLSSELFTKVILEWSTLEILARKYNLVNNLQKEKLLSKANLKICKKTLKNIPISSFILLNPLITTPEELENEVLSKLNNNRVSAKKIVRSFLESLNIAYEKDIIDRIYLYRNNIAHMAEEQANLNELINSLLEFEKYLQRAFFRLLDIQCEWGDRDGLYQRPIIEPNETKATRDQINLRSELNEVNIENNDSLSRQIIDRGVLYLDDEEFLRDFNITLDITPASINGVIILNMAQAFRLTQINQNINRNPNFRLVLISHSITIYSVHFVRTILGNVTNSCDFIGLEAIQRFSG